MRFIPTVALAVLTLVFASPAMAQSMAKSARWSGTVKVEGQLVVEKGVTLTIEPGTNVVFLPGKLDEEGLAESGLLVKGTIIAKGTPGKRILFTSGAKHPAPGDWGEVKLLNSTGSAFGSCDFRFGGWGLHLHDSDIKVEGCTFSDNSYGGMRGQGGSVEITGCTLSGMEVGIRYWKSSPSIHHNTIMRNKTGIFLRQDAEGAMISFNNIFANTEYDIKLGDGQTKDVDASRNWWGTKETSYIRRKIYDKSREDYIGNVIIEPVLPQRVALP
jgi:hypothetical protein